LIAAGLAAVFGAALAAAGFAVVAFAAVRAAGRRVLVALVMPQLSQVNKRLTRAKWMSPSEFCFYLVNDIAAAA
jgi:hypothetical protein